jgi:CHAT domain-containing protein
VVLSELLLRERRFVEATILLRVEKMVAKDRTSKSFHRWIAAAKPALISLNLPLLARLIATRLDLAIDLAENGMTDVSLAQLREAKLEYEEALAVIRSRGPGLEIESLPMFDLQFERVNHQLTNFPSLQKAIEDSQVLAVCAFEMGASRTERLILMDSDSMIHEHALRNDRSGDNVDTSRTLRLQLIKQRMAFESRDLGRAFFLGGCLVQLGTLASTESQSQTLEFLRLLDMFFSTYTDFDVPSMVFALANLAVSKLAKIGDTIREEKYKQIRLLADEKAAGKRTRDPVLLVFLDEKSFSRNFHTLGIEAQHWLGFQRNISVVIVVWIREDVEMKLISSGDVRELLATGLTVETSVLDSKEAILAAAKTFQDTIFAYPVPTADLIWNPWWKAVKSWLERTDLPRSALVRQELLVRIQQSRNDQFGSIMSSFPVGDELNDVLINARTALREYIELLESLRLLRLNGRAALGYEMSMKNLASVKWRFANISQILASQPLAKEKGLISDATLLEAFEITVQCYDQYQGLENLDMMVRTSNLSGQCCWNRHFFFGTIPITDSFQFIRKAERAYRRLRMETFMLKGSRAFVAGQTQASHLQMSIFRALAVRYSLRAWIQKLQGPGIEAIPAIPKEYTAEALRDHFAWWIQTSKGQALTDMLGLDAHIPASVVPDHATDPYAFSLLQIEDELTKKLETASIAERVQIRQEFDSNRIIMRQQPALAEVLNLRDGFSFNTQDIRTISSTLTSDVVLVDWVWILFADAWDLAIVTHRNGVISGIRILPIKVIDVEKWAQDQLQAHEPLKHRRAAVFLRKLDALVAPLAELTKPNETLIFCPTKALYRLPLHALRIGGQVAIERNPIVYCQSLSVLHLCQTSVLDASRRPKSSFKACVFTPISNIYGLNEDLAEVAKSLNTTVTPPTSSPKQAFLIACTQASLIHFQGHSQLSDSSPLNQHLDFSGEALLEEEKEAEDMLTVNELFDTRLQRPAFATIMGCSSNQARISDCDDLLGLVTALHYAGASSVISALWPIDSRDGIAFSRVFYERLMADMAVDDTATTVNVARAMQAAILALKAREGMSWPYHWAGLILNGAWLFPKDSIGKTSTNASNA